MKFGICLAAGVVLAAVPATAETHPDLTGIWTTPFRVHSSGLGMIGGSTAWTPASMGDIHKAHILSVEEQSAIADRSVAEHHGVPIFGRPPPPPLPVTPAGRAVLAKQNFAVDEARTVACYPTNLIDRAGASPVQIVQNDKAVALMYEGGTPGRTVFMDNRSQADAIPQWNGMSVGHWEGRTLKIVSVAIRGESAGFTPPRLPFDENVKLTEEYTLLPDGQHLDLVMTLEDPTLYTEPLKKLVHMARTTDVMVTDYTCIEGKDDMVEMTVKAAADGGGTKGATATFKAAADAPATKGKRPPGT